MGQPVSQPATSLERQRAIGREAIASHDHLLRQGILKLLAIKDSDIRILVLEQCRGADAMRGSEFGVHAERVHRSIDGGLEPPTKISNPRGARVGVQAERSELACAIGGNFRLSVSAANGEE